MNNQSTSTAASVETYVIDPDHSSVAFKIRHFVTKVLGVFGKLEGAIILDRGDLEKSSVSVTIDIGSIYTANDKRDAHLKSADFFDADKYPKATFVSTAWKKTGDNKYDITGNLTLHGVSKPVVLHAELLAFGADGDGLPLVGWQASATLSKKEFGIAGPAVLATVLGDGIAIAINIEAAVEPGK